MFTNKALGALEELTQAAWKTPHSSRVDSLTNYHHSRAEGDDLIVEPMKEDETGSLGFMRGRSSGPAAKGAGRSARQFTPHHQLESLPSPVKMMPMDLNLPLGGAFGRFIVLVLMLVLGRCTTGGGNRIQGADKRAEEPCIRVHVGDCLAPEKVAESAAELAAAYRDEDDFRTRWELGHIKAALAWRPNGSPLGLRAGWLGERQTLLGGTAQGAFGGLAGGTAFVGLEAETMLGNWRLGATTESGTVNPTARGGVIDAISALTTSTFTLQASRRLANAGLLRFSISQPLRVEQGRAALMVPVGRTKAGEVVRMPVPAELAPSGRQLDMAVHWYQPLIVGELRLGVVATHQPGHRATAGPALTLLSGWRWTF